ncbi:histidine-rich glycoprotein-like [Uranotaenia lowii]|uniref:histidine-rich glycoprotein-like n=1 Tax=Uranotaenia lowii TaxID=190385 RepID=UPI00247AE3E4|nr:histidine-rich glycoprotein-like [Uranotaenia lowii]
MLRFFSFVALAVVAVSSYRVHTGHHHEEHHHVEPQAHHKMEAHHEPEHHHHEDHHIEVPHDYFAHAKYKYDYGVEDPHTGNHHSHWEERDGDVVKGAYTLFDSDGSTRIVEYTADPLHGFKAVVKKIQHKQLETHEHEHEHHGHHGHHHEPELKMHHGHHEHMVHHHHVHEHDHEHKHHE